MGSANQVDVVLFEELFDNGLSESVGDTSVIFTPARLTLLGIRPKQVTEQTVLRDLGRAGDLLQLSDCDQLRRESSVHAEDFVVDESCNRHAVEHILKLFPDADAVAALALVVKPVDSVDLTALVVASQQEEVLLEFYLVCEQQNYRLQRILAAVNIVTEEEIVSFRRESTIFKKSEKVRKLSMCVACLKVEKSRVSLLLKKEGVCLLLFIIIQKAYVSKIVLPR